MERTAAYIRVSTQEQKMHGLSIDAQEQKLTEYAQKNNLDIVEWYRDEGVSGRKLIRKRPELQRMIHDAEAGRFKRIIFIKLDRFFRSVAEYHECMKQIGDVVWTATEEKYDMTTANGRAFINMKLTINELEADQTGERIKLVNQYKVTSGRPLCGTASMPFCYAVDSNEESKRIVKRNQMAADAFFEHFDAHRSIRAAIIMLYDEYKIRLWYDGAKKLLRNPMICGEYRGNINYCEPYISRDKFSEWQEYFRCKHRTRTQINTYLFGGMIECPSCGNILAGAPHYETRSKRSLLTYRCDRCWTTKACDFKLYVFENTIEKKMIDRMSEELEGYNLSVQGGNIIRKAIDVDSLRSELARLSYMFERGRISIEEYDRKYEDVERRISEAELQNKKSQPPKIFADFDGDWLDTYAKLNHDGKASFWRSVLKRIHIDWSKDVKRISDVEFL